MARTAPTAEYTPEPIDGAAVADIRPPDVRDLCHNGRRAQDRPGPAARYPGRGR